MVGLIRAFTPADVFRKSTNRDIPGRGLDAEKLTNEKAVVLPVAVFLVELPAAGRRIPMTGSGLLLSASQVHDDVFAVALDGPPVSEAVRVSDPGRPFPNPTVKSPIFLEPGGPGVIDSCPPGWEKQRPQGPCLQSRSLSQTAARTALGRN